jgi:hypothetical protein
LYTDAISGAASADAQLRLKFSEIAGQYPIDCHKLRKPGKTSWIAIQT